MRRRTLAAIVVLLSAGALWSCYVQPVGVVGQPGGYYGYPDYVYPSAPWVAGPPDQVYVYGEPGFRDRDRNRRDEVRGEIWYREQDRRQRDDHARMEGQRGRPGIFGGPADRGRGEGRGGEAGRGGGPAVGGRDGGRGGAGDGRGPAR